MATPLLAVAIIMKNEAENIRRCLDSINHARPLVDAVYIYDTGSTDGSQEIAESMGAIVQQGFWDGDFSRARNECLKMAEARWVLHVDADEELEVNQPLLRKHLRRCSDSAFATYVWINCSNSDIDGSGHYMSRIARRGRSVWTGALHETLNASKPKFSSLNAPKIPRNEILIRHTGYFDRDALGKKLSRNLEIAEKDLGDAILAGDIGRARNSKLNIALTKSGLGDHREALDIILEIANGPNSIKEPYSLYITEVICSQSLDAGIRDDVLDLLRAHEIHGGSGSFRTYLYAKYAYAIGDYSESWQLARTINELEYSSSPVAPRQDLITLRHLAAVECGEMDDALSTALILITKYKLIGPMLPRALALWGNRDKRQLATLLNNADDDVRHNIKALTEKMTKGWDELSEYLITQPDEKSTTLQS